MPYMYVIYTLLKTVTLQQDRYTVTNKVVTVYSFQPCYKIAQ